MWFFRESWWPRSPRWPRRQVSAQVDNLISASSQRSWQGTGNNTKLHRPVCFQQKKFEAAKITQKGGKTLWICPKAHETKKQNKKQTRNPELLQHTYRVSKKHSQWYHGGHLSLGYKHPQPLQIGELRSIKTLWFRYTKQPLPVTNIQPPGPQAAEFALQRPTNQCLKLLFWVGEDSWKQKKKKTWVNWRISPFFFPVEVM